MLTREQIAAFRRPTIAVMVPDLGGEVGMRALSGAEMAQVYSAMPDGFDPQRFDRMVSVLSLCDEAGARLYAIGEADAVWSELTADACGTLLIESRKLNRLGTEARADARKESDATPS